MKHLLLYEGYSSSERLDDILDKISKYGISSLTYDEKSFLDAHSQGKERDVHVELEKVEKGKVFNDDFGYFKFEYNDTIDFGDEVHHTGVLYVPDLEFNNGKRLDGMLSGKIIVYNNGTTSLEFESSDGYDIFEFCNGLEYELDNFIDIVIDNLKERKM
jgi:hypothetical protein